MAFYIKQCDDFWIIKDEVGYGNALLLRTPWSPRFLDVIRAYDVKVIRVNEHTGWEDSDLSFLADIPGIHGVDVLSEKVVDVSPILRLEQLRTLSLFCKARVAGDFRKLVHLRHIGLGWRNVFASVFGLNTLQSVNIIGYPERDLTRWERTNIQLKRLQLESKVLDTLHGIRLFPNLRRLELHRCRKLESLDEIASSVSMRELTISSCPGIRDWSPVSRLRELKVLEIEDCHDIQSAVPFGQCQKLERLQIAGNTTILNGDLSTLAALPNLKQVLLARKKHYSHSPEELGRTVHPQHGSFL